MANTIELFKQYTTLLDDVYKQASLTSDLDGASDLVQQGANANELVIPMIEMDGLADYSRNSGYVDGDVSLTNQTVECNFDRGRMFTVDTMDNAETAGLAFGKLSSEFIRTKVVPELDAFRFAKYASIENISKVTANLSTGEEVIKALRVATTQMNNDEVPYDQRFLYVTSLLKGIIDDMDTTKSREVLSKFSKIVEVPQSRFYTAIKQNDGKTDGQTKGSYVKGEDALNINFMVVHKPAVIQFTKHLDTKVIEPAVNQSGDGWKFGYRMVGIARHYKNKTAGIYLHTAPATV
jgi:hypothetical protein